jgi:hypothetical protein
VSRRNAPPRTHKKKLSDLRTVVEPLEPRAMLAGLGQDSLSGLGSITAVLLPRVSSPLGIVLTGGSPTLGSTVGTGGSQSNGPVLLGGTGSGTGSASSGSAVPHQMARCSLAARDRELVHPPAGAVVPHQMLRCSWAARDRGPAHPAA